MNKRQREDDRIDKIIEVLQDKKALDISLMDLRGVTDAVDYFILCTCTSELHVKGLVKDLIGVLKAADHRPWHVEGTNSNRWVLVDYVDLVVHIFRREAREFYSLERLWGDAQITCFAETEPAEEVVGEFILPQSQ